MEQTGHPCAVESADLRALDDFLFREQPEQQLRWSAFLDNYNSCALVAKLAQLQRTVETLRVTFVELSHRWELLTGLNGLVDLPTAEDTLSIPLSPEDPRSLAPNTVKCRLLECSARRHALDLSNQTLRERVNSYEADCEQERRATEMREELGRVEFERLQQEEGSEFREDVGFDPRVLWPTWDMDKWMNGWHEGPLDPTFATWVEFE